MTDNPGHLVVLPAVLSLLAACSAPGTTPTDAAGGDAQIPPTDALPSDPDARATDATTPGADATLADGASVDAPAPPPSDGASCLPRSAACAHPPAGYVTCGGGAIDPAAARSACDAVDPGTQLGMAIPKSCTAFTIGRAHYEAYCGPGGVYFWVSLDELSSTDVSRCPRSLPLPDGGALEFTRNILSWDLGDPNQLSFMQLTPSSGPRMLGMTSRIGYPTIPDRSATDPARWQGSVAVDSNIPGASLAGTSGTGTLYLAYPREGCETHPTTGEYAITLALPVTWRAP